MMWVGRESNGRTGDHKPAKDSVFIREVGGPAASGLALGSAWGQIVDLCVCHTKLDVIPDSSESLHG